LITHNLDVVAETADRIAAICIGEMAEIGSVDLNKLVKLL